MDEAKLKIAKDAAVTEFLGMPGVTGVGYGLKFRSGHLTDEIGVVVHVAEKRALVDIPRDERIPGQFAGLPTDVIQARFKPHFRDKSSDLLSIIHPGLSVGPAAALQVGTLGPIVKDIAGNIYAISSWHVMATLGTGVLYDSAICPGALDIGEHDYRTIGVPGDYILDEHGDAVLIPLTVDAINESLILHGLCRCGSISVVTTPWLWAYGRTTGLTYGKVVAEGVLAIDYSAYGMGTINMNCVEMYRGVLIGDDGTDAPMSAEGDSGMCWEYDKATQDSSLAGVIGLHVGGDETGHYAVACWYNEVLTALGVSSVDYPDWTENRKFSWGSFNVASGQEYKEARGSFIAVPNNADLVLRATTTQEKYYVPRFSLVGDEYVEDDAGLYVEDPDNPDEYILLSEHPTGGYYAPVEEILADSGVHYVG